ncbi:MAG: threonine/serine dehydratase [Cyclobacteriaceae bacterium]|nr:threonine/serine dehydratase [Cyclobacteriaceae bacterium]
MKTGSRLSYDRIEEAFRKIDPVFLRTPQYISDTLSALLNATLVLKIETQNPIRSFKGRGADFLITESDANTTLICASAGNFGQAMAYACRKKNIKLIVYASVRANPLKIERMKQLGATIILHGDDFDSAKLQAKQFAKDSGARFIEDSLDIETVEGAGTIGLELLDFATPIDVLLIALGNGAMINGIGSIFKERNPSTQIVAVQASGAPAMVESWKKKTVITHESVNTIADGIAVRIPVPEALADMEGIVDDAVLVREDSIIKAMKLLHRHAGIVAEPSGAVGLAAILEHPDIYASKTVATIICGGNMTQQQLDQWLCS